jgi:hypothetical protein
MQRRLLQSVIAASLTVIGLVGLGETASAGSDEQQPAELVRIRDDCDRRTYNAALGAGACVGDGGTTFDELVAELTERREAGGWSFSARRLEIRQGRGLRAVNEGGEVHSFTEVQRFGPGCVPEVNQILGFPAGARVRECRTNAWLQTLRAPGAALRVSGLHEGTHRFECLIHPWMRTTVQVRAAN